jgi:hypothetical protein
VVTERILQQGQALVRAIEALEVIEPTSPIERVQAWFPPHDIEGVSGPSWRRLRAGWRGRFSAPVKRSARSG